MILLQKNIKGMYYSGQVSLLVSAVLFWKQLFLSEILGNDEGPAETDLDWFIKKVNFFHQVGITVGTYPSKI